MSKLFTLKGFRLSLMMMMIGAGCITSYGQTAPGGVSNGLRTWYKADAITPVASGTDISSWADQATADGTQDAVQNSVNTNAVSGNRKPQYRTASARYNFNPYLDFSKPYASLMAYKAHSNTGDYAVNYTQGATVYQVGDLVNVRGSFIGTALGATTAAYAGNYYEWGYPWLGLNAGYYGVACSYFWGTGSDWWFNSSNWWYNNPRREKKITNNVPWINAIAFDRYGTNKGVYLAANDAQTALQVRKDGDRWSWGYTYTPPGPALYIGNELVNYNAGRWWKGNIPEVILYDRKLTTTVGGEADRLDSYLALKYGITLFHSYYISDGATVWDTAGNKFFNNQVAGIVRDNASALNQKQSRSIYYAPIVTMSVGNMDDKNNALNTGNIADKHTLVWGSNNVPGNLVNGGPIPGGFDNFQTAVGGPSAGIESSTIAFTRKSWLVQEQTGKDLGSVKVYIESKDVQCLDWSRNTWIMVGTNANFSNPRFYPLTLAASTLGSASDYVADINFCEGATNPSTVIGGIKCQYFAIVGAKKLLMPGGVAGVTVWCRADMGVYADSVTRSDAADGEKVHRWLNLAGTRDAYGEDTGRTASPVFRKASIYDNFHPMVDFSKSTMDTGVGMYLLDVNKYTGSDSQTIKFNTFYGFSSNRALNGGREVINTISATNYNSPGVYPQLANNATGSGNYANYGWDRDDAYSLGKTAFKKNENIIATSYVDTTGAYASGSPYFPYINQSNWRNGRDSATLSGAAISSNNAPGSQTVSNQNQYFAANLHTWYDYYYGMSYRPEHAMIGYYRGNRTGARDNYATASYTWSYNPPPYYYVQTSLEQRGGTYIQEVLSFQKKLSRNERERIQTYLGIRNGSTVFHNYLATGGEVIYDISYTDAAPNGGAPNNRYTYSITGIGRDDIEWLDQKVSRNCLDTLVTISLGQIPSDEDNNSVDAIFANDKEYIIWGSNGGNQNIRSTTDLPLNAGCMDSRLNREYHIHLTGSNTGNYETQVRWQLDNNILDAISLTTILLVIDEDGDGNYQTGPIRTIAASSYDAATNTVLFDNVAWSAAGDPNVADAAMTIGWSTSINGVALYGKPGAGNEGGGCTTCDDPDYTTSLLCNTLAGTAIYGNNTTRKGYMNINWDANTSNCANANVVVKVNTPNANRRKVTLNTRIGGSSQDSAAVLGARLFKITRNASCSITKPITVRVYYDPAEITTDSAWLNGNGANLNQPLITDSSGLQWFAFNGDFNETIGNFSASGLPVGDIAGKAILLTPNGIGIEEGINYVEFFISKPDVTIGWYQKKVVVSNKPFFKAKVLLQGALPNTGTIMRDDLRKGFASSGNIIPRTQPYNSPAFGNYAGIDSVSRADSATRFADQSNNSIVDWILLEFRDKTSQTTIISRRAFLVQRDGDIIDAATGSDSLYINESGITLDNYYVSVRHRNHLGVMFANTIDFKAANGAILDFTDISKDLYTKTAGYDGSEAAQVGGKRALWAGDANSNGNVRSSLLGNDQTFISNSLLNHPLNTTHSPTFTVNGYLNADINMNGQLKVSLLGNDQVILTNYILFNVLNPTHDPLFVLVQQLP